VFAAHIDTLKILSILCSLVYWAATEVNRIILMRKNTLETIEPNVITIGVLIKIIELIKLSLKYEFGLMKAIVNKKYHHNEEIERILIYEPKQ